MLLKNASILYGDDLQYIENTNIRISEQIFKKIKQNLASNPSEEKLDCEGLVIIPGFVNAHTHIGDSIAKDISLESTAEVRIHPMHGVKSKRNELAAILQKCDGIGVSGANEYSDSVLKYYSTTKKIRAIHSAETKQSCTLSKKMTKKSETHQCLLLNQ